MKLLSAIAVIACSIPISAEADEYMEPKQLAEAYLGNCVLNAGRIDKTKAAARTFGYSELDEDMALMLAPQDPNADFRAWAAGGSKSELFFLGVSESEIDRQKMAVCVVAHPYVSSTATVAEIKAILNFGDLVSDEVSVGQRTRIWTADHVVRGALIILTDVQQIGEVGGTYGFMAPAEE